MKKKLFTPPTDFFPVVTPFLFKKKSWRRESSILFLRNKTHFGAPMLTRPVLS